MSTIDTSTQEYNATPAGLVPDIESVPFSLEGTISIAPGIRPVINPNCSCSALRLPDGRIVRPQIVLEVEDPTTGTFLDLSTDEEMASIGIPLLDYSINLEPDSCLVE